MRFECSGTGTYSSFHDWLFVDVYKTRRAAYCGDDNSGKQSGRAASDLKMPLRVQSVIFGERYMNVRPQPEL